MKWSPKLKNNLSSFSHCVNLKTNFMRKIKIGHLADGSTFKKSQTSKITYTIIKKEKGQVIFTSNNSNRSFSVPPKTEVYQDQGY